jgi:transposase
LVTCGRSSTSVARDLDLTETALRDWGKRADVDAGKTPPTTITTDERAPRAATFFAKENG